jgi:hypothetical protein
MCADNAPKAGRVVCFEEMSEFVNDHVVYYKYRCLDETPIETQIVVHGARAPAVTIINDLGRSKLYAKTASVLLDAVKNLFFGSGNVPIS